MYIAYLSTESNPIVVETTQHVVQLDPVPMTYSIFKNVFYGYGDAFTITSNPSLSTYISFKNKTVNTKTFSLDQTILSNISEDLHLPQACFTVDSVIELTRELVEIQTLGDLSTKVTSSLNLNTLEGVIRQQESGDVLVTVGVVFKTPTQGVHPTLINFNYTITNFPFL